MIFPLLISAAFFASAAYQLLGHDEDAELRKTGQRTLARFSNFDCKSSGGTAGQRSRTDCFIDVEFDLPAGGMYSARVAIREQRARCVGGPPYHVGTEAPVFFEPDRPEDFAYEVSPCDVQIPEWIKALIYVVVGLGFVGLGIAVGRKPKT